MGLGPAPAKSFQLWKPTLWCYFRRGLMSDSFAWAIQNAVGVLFTVLFAVIGDMTFTLACVSACLYTAASQVLSLDRTVGGRLFSAALFTGCMLSAGLLGGVISTIAWQARGDAIGLMEYLPSAFQKIPSKDAQGLILEWFPRLAAVPWPEFVQNQFKTVQKEIQEIETELIPEAAPAFWILLMVLFIVFSLPFAVARASKDFRIGILMGISTLFMGSQVLFASLMPTLGLRLYWTQITMGYVKVALVNTGAMVITGLLFLSTSAHDAVREQLGALLQNTGLLLSQCGSAIALTRGSGGGSLEKVADMKRKSFNRLKNAAEIEEALLKESRIMAGVAVAAADDEGDDGFAAAGGGGALKSGKHADEENIGVADNASTQSSNRVPNNNYCLTALELQRHAHEIGDDGFGAVLFEPPVLGVVSQPGSNMFQYKTVLEAAEKLINVAGSIEACAMETQFELLHGQDVSAELVDLVRSSISQVVASCAAVCADLSVVLRHMPLGKPCSGSKLSWKPRSADFYQDLHKNLSTIADRLTPAMEKLAIEQGINIIDLTFMEGRATLAVVANCELLLKAVAEVENDVALALRIVNHTPETPQSTSDKPPESQKSSWKDRIMQNAYAPSFLALFGIGLGIPVWLFAIKSLIDMSKGLFKCFTSAEYRKQVLKSRTTQFAVKYWISLCLAVVGILLLLWKGEGSQGSPIANVYNIDYFFFVWQPIYFWITAAICIQKQVEAAVFRSILRSLMTVVGGVLGYCTMLNGSLAQNPYFVASMVALFNGVCGLLAPNKTLRYSLFLMAFTYNAVVVCQYVGCCDVAGDPKVFGGKVLSTLFGSLYAMLASWCFFPLYTSEVVLKIEAQALQAGVKLIKRQYEWIRSTAKSKNAGLDDADLQQQEQQNNWARAVEDELRVRLAEVRKELEVNVLDRKQLMLTWNVLPTPPIVGILLPRLSNLADCLATAGSVAETSLWPREPGPAQSALLESLHERITAVEAAAEAAAEASAACMAATSRSSVAETRAVVAEKVKILRSARAALRAEFVAWNENGAHPAWTRGDYRFLAWMHLMLMAVREVEVASMILAEREASLDRDGYFAWASSWFGRRPV